MAYIEKMVEDVDLDSNGEISSLAVSDTFLCPVRLHEEKRCGHQAYALAFVGAQAIDAILRESGSKTSHCHIAGLVRMCWFVS